MTKGFVQPNLREAEPSFSISPQLTCQSSGVTIRAFGIYYDLHCEPRVGRGEFMIT